jgi:hypothetical protein
MKGLTRPHGTHALFSSDRVRDRLVALVVFVDETADAIVSRELDCIFDRSSGARSAQREDHGKGSIERLEITCGSVWAMDLRKRHQLLLSLSSLEENAHGKGIQTEMRAFRESEVSHIL